MPNLLNPYRFGVTSAYAAAVLSDSPILYWRLGEASGTTAVDSSGNGRNGSYSLSPTLGATGLITGDTDTAMTTTVDSGQIAGINSATWMDVNNITVEIVCKVSSSTDGSNGDAIASRYTSGGGFNWLLWRNTTGHWAVQVRNNSSTTYNVAASASVSLNTKYHLAFTFDGSNLILYVDGSNVASTSVTGTLQTGTSPIEVPRYSQASVTEPAGTFDEFAVYSTALSSTRISAHYALV